MSLVNTGIISHLLTCKTNDTRISFAAFISADGLLKKDPSQFQTHTNTARLISTINILKDSSLAGRVTVKVCDLHLKTIFYFKTETINDPEVQIKHFF